MLALKIVKRQAILRDASCLYAMKELEAQTAPIRDPSSWIEGSWPSEIIFDEFEKADLYRTSAILSAHIESATLPLR